MNWKDILKIYCSVEKMSCGWAECSERTKKALTGKKSRKDRNNNNKMEDKDFEIADLNSSHADQLWELDKLEKENAQMKEVCGGVAAYEKKIKQYIKKESVDN